MLTVAQALGQAVQQHQAGNLPQAEQLYRAILQVDPQQVDALQLLGLIAYQLGQHETATAYLQTRPAFTTVRPVSVSSQAGHAPRREGSRR